MRSALTHCATPSLWHAYHLERNPYQVGLPDIAHVDAELVVGRSMEREALVAGVTQRSLSAQLILGPPGAGKRTLARQVRADLSAAGWLTGAPLEISQVDSVAGQALHILAAAYESVLATADPRLAEAAIMVEIRRIVRGCRLSSGFFVESAEPVVRLLADLGKLACGELGRAGLVLQLNIDDEGVWGVAGSGYGFRRFLGLPNYHWLVVSGSQAAAEPFLGLERSADAVRMINVAPLTVREVRDLLAKRYRFLRRDASVAAIPPVSAAGALAIYGLYRGDLRGTLRALEEAADALAGYGRDAATRSLEESDILAVLRPRYAAEFQRSASAPLIDQFVQLRAYMEDTFTQDQLIELWRVTRPRVSQVLARLRELGFVREARREGRRVFYELTGPARVIFS